MQKQGIKPPPAATIKEEKLKEKDGKEKRKEKESREKAPGTVGGIAVAPLAIDANYQAVFNLLDECLFPALALSADAESQFALPEELWNSVLRYLPYDHRYRLYGQWKSNGYGTYSMLQARKKAINDRVRYIMKYFSLKCISL